MTYFVQQFLNSLQLGSLYALIALGYTMVYGVLLLINFAHGDIFMIGAFLGVTGSMVLGLPFVPTLLLSMTLTGLMGVAIERIAYKPIRHASRLSVVITALGVGLLLENGMLALTGADPRSYPADFITTTTYNVEGISISNVKIIIIVLAFVLFIGLYLIVQRTKWGMAMRAISYDKFAVPLMGVSQDQIISLTFLMGASLAAAGGILWGVAFPVLNPYMGMRVGWKAFIAAVVGGIGDIRGAMLGGLLLGFIEIMVPAYGQDIGISSTWRDPIAFALLLLILVIRPTGLFGVARRQKV
ncbi:MAG TPA: branched-chain amino acid ABC transporter permease [Aggregatilinea sp.]|jgi:branched-chain amino acid transport system permease protein|uniref:branched-chain amino acid ABC transporter permease n=1 Tax=Aggregatilinea sp. TaxID=2806333 RepID=UPI002CD15EB9|nr:branched-chain amino acid ABC transporter permease [Aggregatilinea sp.]HML20586.1 branched-chain amino acid ABC transporter permease [Aggregatilinea sp.]